MELTEQLEDTAMSYEEWGDAGFAIVYGTKSRLRGVDGLAQFTLDQVRPVTARAKKILPDLWDPITTKNPKNEHDNITRRCIAKKNRTD